jgi:post-segregation antitoxin (ccd killing protein)
LSRQKRLACGVHELGVFFHVVVQPTVVDLNPRETVLHQLLNVADVAPVHPTVVAVADVAARLVADLRARGLNVSAALHVMRSACKKAERCVVWVGGRGGAGGCSRSCSRTTRAGCPWMPRSRSALSDPGICAPDAARGSDDARSRQQARPAAAAAAAHLVLLTMGRPSSSWKALVLEGITW